MHRHRNNSSLIILSNVKLLLVLFLSLNFVSCTRISNNNNNNNNNRRGSFDFRPMEAKEVTLPIIERYYLLIKYHEPVCGFEDTEIAKAVCWSDKANNKIKFNHTRQLADDLTFCNGTTLPLPEAIYKRIDDGANVEVLNSPVSHLNAIALIDGVASIQLIKNLDNNKGTGAKMKYDAQLILDDLLYKAASEKSIEFFSTYKGLSNYYLHKPKFMDLITRLNVYLSTNINDKSSFLELPTRLWMEMLSQASNLTNMYQDPDHDLTLTNIVRGFGLGESDFASLSRLIYLERCTHEADRQMITMDFVYRSTQKFTYLLPYDPKMPYPVANELHGAPKSHVRSVTDWRATEQQSPDDQPHENLLDLAKRRIQDTVTGVFYY